MSREFNIFAVIISGVRRALPLCYRQARHTPSHSCGNSRHGDHDILYTTDVRPSLVHSTQRTTAAKTQKHGISRKAGVCKIPLSCASKKRRHLASYLPNAEAICGGPVSLQVRSTLVLCRVVTVALIRVPPFPFLETLFYANNVNSDDGWQASLPASHWLFS